MAKSSRPVQKTKTRLSPEQRRRVLYQWVFAAMAILVVFSMLLASLVR